MRLIHATVAAIGLTAGLAAAPAMSADNGFYAGAGVGYYQLDAGYGWDAGDFAWKIRAGYDFIKYFGIEVEYIDGGSPKDFDVSITTTGWNFSAVGRYPFNDSFNVFAKLGAMTWDAKGNHGLGSDNGTDFSWGLGAGWNVGKHFELDAEYQGLDVADGAEFWTVSGIYRF
ncbi:MAG: porin family protein [Steroidobacteraceae bacterium]